MFLAASLVAQQPPPAGSSYRGVDAGDPRRRFYSAGGEGETVKGARPAGEPRRPAVRVGTNRLGM